MLGMRVLAAAGVVAAFGAVQAGAWQGELVRCEPDPGKEYIVEFSKGLSCTNAKQKIKAKDKVKTVDGGLNGCTANPAAPFAVWKEGKYEKYDGSLNGDLAQAEISLKGSTFGTCDFAGNSESAGASSAGAITFLDNGTIKPGKVSKIKGAKLKFFGNISGDLDTFSAVATGLITKGFGVGGEVELQIGLNLAPSDPELAAQVGILVGCQGGGCADPNNPANEIPVTDLPIITTGSSYLVIRRGDPNDPNFVAIP